jgi:glyoxylase-like metal-dependent hydrolase (beta-lactamase superfamily II)
VLLLETFPVSSFQCNCSVIGCPDTKEAIVVDPGGDADKVAQVLAHYDLSVRWIVHTHAHLDHIAGTREVKQAAAEAGPATIALHRDDTFLYDGFATQAQMFGWRVQPVLPVEHWLQHEESLSFGKLAAKVLHTPGHTPGSCCFHLEVGNRSLLLAGDTLFSGSVGRTDLPGGNFQTLEHSIRDRLYTLDDDTVVIPGHGPPTKVGDEARHNPFVRKSS